MPVSFSFTINIEAPDVQALTLNGQREGLTIMLPAINALTRAAAIAVQTYSGQPYVKQLALSGADAGRFSLSNSGLLPCDLMVGAVSLTTGVYGVSLTAP